MPGTNFYRLVQTDLDARTSFSKVLTVITGADAMLITYPNPVTNGILTVQTAAPVVLYVYDNSGKLVQQQQAIAGTQQLDLSRLAKGIYFLKAGAATQKIFIK
ncbi:MAG: T9SS type A sorting domain-containing protein [Lewinellaceae bacterium]|nr:T9SS type A sorting domain-containing protein [Lewinellaceae bacterium]